MGKTKKMKLSQMANKVPLEQDIQDARIAKNKNRNKIRLRQVEDEQVNQQHFDFCIITIVILTV